MMLTLRFVRSATITVVSPFAMAVPVQSQAPPVSLEGRQSVEQMKKFEPFVGRWRRVEYPPGTPISAGACTFEPSNHGITMDYRCGPEDDPGERTTIFWHPTDRKLVYRMYSVRFPTDLLFEGDVQFPETGTVQFVYRGYYGDGRILTYRDTKTIGADGRLTTVTEEFKLGQWTRIFPGSVYIRDG
jgi:hypothetical protein